jgi:hypothetical protein
MSATPHEVTMPKYLIVAFLSAIGNACNALAAGLAALPEEEHDAAPAPPPAPTIPAPPTAIEGETYASLRARGGARVSGPDGEIGAGSVFSSGGWSPGA